MLSLPTVTLIAVDCAYVSRTIAALRECLAVCNFGDVALLSDSRLPEVTDFIPKLDTSRKYSSFVLHSLHEYVHTEYMLIFQHDGFILNPEAWDSTFLSYDYIGAPVSWGSGLSVGNGGFSLRSKKLMVAASERFKTWSHISMDTHPEDFWLCEAIGPELREQGFRFAPVDVAARFACGNKHWEGEFGFHGRQTDLSGWSGMRDFLGTRDMYTIIKHTIPEAIPGRDE